MATLSTTVHTSVLTNEIVEFLNPRGGDVVLDATLGGGGHTEALLARPRVTVVGIDADEEAIARARGRLGRFGERVLFIHGNFRDVRLLLDAAGVESLSHALFDLGMSSDQLESSGRGFSFMRDEPLTMTFGEPQIGIDARTLLNEWSEESIANVLWGYGEERYAKRIARTIVQTRDTSPIEKTSDLVALVERSVPALYRRGRTHPATKTFQALRIAVNDELAAIEKGLTDAVSLLSKGGRIAVISFHSIEDRAVKKVLKNLTVRGSVLSLTKKPLTPTFEEKGRNPRARSAKLRVAEKL
ncbi:MAG TPA: 16S rRNA (cytosine(1402)-N(4))-methyltransferase RsmH [Candidatus Paceibacterota bacterium]